MAACSELPDTDGFGVLFTQNVKNYTLKTLLKGATVWKNCRY
jgi:hypothetical protein